jgi:PAS domain S-box-containing protein
MSWPEALFLVSGDGRILALNRAGSRILGQKDQSLLGQRIVDLVADSAGKVSHYLRVCSRNKEPMPGTLAWLKSDGKVIKCRCDGFAVRPGTDNSPALILLHCEPQAASSNKFIALNKTLEGLRVSHHKLLTQAARLKNEITEREKAEEQLRESFEQFRTIMDSLDALVYVADMDTYELLFINKYGRDIWGNIVGKICWKSLQNNQTEPCKFCTNEKLLDINGEPTGVYHWEFQNTVNNEWYDCRDQAIRWIDGRLVRMEIATNITERKKEEENLRRTSEILENVFSTSTFLIAYMDADFNFIRVNKSYAEADKHTPEYFIGKNHFDLFPSEENKAIFHQVIETGRPYSTCAKPFVYLKHPERGVTYWDWSLFPVKDLNGNIEALELFLVNVTQRKQAEEELKARNREIEELNVNLKERVQKEVEKSHQKDLIMIQQSRLAAMGKLIGLIAHQWRQPLSALNILLYNINDLFQDNELSENILNDFIEKGTSLVMKMSTTIDGFRNFFKPSKEKEKFSINNVINDALSMIDASLKHHNIAVVVKEENINVVGFPNEYSQLILDILNNAKDAIVTKGVKGEIKIEVYQENDSAAVKISDNGGGIPEDIINSIFDPYFTTKAEGKGNDGAEFKIIIPTK